MSLLCRRRWDRRSQDAAPGRVVNARPATVEQMSGPPRATRGRGASSQPGSRTRATPSRPLEQAPCRFRPRPWPLASLDPPGPPAGERRLGHRQESVAERAAVDAKNVGIGIALTIWAPLFPSGPARERPRDRDPRHHAARRALPWQRGEGRLLAFARPLRRPRAPIASRATSGGRRSRSRPRPKAPALRAFRSALTPAPRRSRAKSARAAAPAGRPALRPDRVLLRPRRRVARPPAAGARERPHRRVRPHHRNRPAGAVHGVGTPRTTVPMPPTDGQSRGRPGQRRTRATAPDAPIGSHRGRAG